MRKQYITGSDTEPFEIIEDEHNDQVSANPNVQQGKFHPSDELLEKLSKATQKALDKNK